MPKGIPPSPLLAVYASTVIEALSRYTDELLQAPMPCTDPAGIFYARLKSVRTLNSLYGALSPDDKMKARALQYRLIRAFAATVHSARGAA